MNDEGRLCCGNAHATTAEDVARLEQGIDALRGRLEAWMRETPSVCACDVIEVLASSLVLGMTTLGVNLPPREFQRNLRSVLAATRERALAIHRQDWS